jgi:hypothetical protein
MLSIQERLIQLYDYVNSDDFPTPVAVSEDVQREESDSDNSSEYDEILTVLSDEYDGISELLEQRHNVKATPQRVFEWSIYDMPGDSTAFAILYP